MLRPRIIPCLLVHRKGLVKTRRFAEPKYVGDPMNAVRIFNEKEADELMVLDIDATIEGRDPDLQLIENLARECRMPLCYGGGVVKATHARQIIGLGVEKVALSAAAMARPALIKEIAEEIGRQSVVVVLDVRRSASGRPEVWVRNGKINTGQDAIAAAETFQEIGAGEIVLNSIDRDGEMIGYDLELVRRVRQRIRIPMSVLGGAGSLSHLQELVHECGIIGAAAGSLFVFKGAYRAVLINYPNQATKEKIFQAAGASAAKIFNL